MVAQGPAAARERGGWFDTLGPAFLEWTLLTHLTGAGVVEWQTRTFEGRVGKPMRVRVPPPAPFLTL
jgi:hypothetical protein